MARLVKGHDVAKSPAMTQPAKRELPEANASPSLKQKTVTNFLGGSTPKQTALTSFFCKAKPSTPTQMAVVMPPAITPLANETRAITINDNNPFDDQDAEEEDIIVKPSKLLASASRQRIRIDDDDEDELFIESTKSSPLATRLKNLASVPRTPLSLVDKMKSSTESKKKEIVEEDPERYQWLVSPKDINGNRPDHPDYDERTLYIPPQQWSKFTPFERQFWEIKSKLMDTVVFFKKGKFYELYEGDADIGAQRFDLKMTDRVNMRMVGVPEATFDHWARKFVAAGYRIARVDQTETAISKGMRDRESKAAGASKADKIIKRELSSILTLGTLVDPGLLTSDLATFCLALFCDNGNRYGVTFVDASTAAFFLCDFEDDFSQAKLITLLMQIRPKEVIVAKGNLPADVLKLVKTLLPFASFNTLVPGKEFWETSQTADEIDKAAYFKGYWPEPLLAAKDSKPFAFRAFGGLLSYLRMLKLDHSLLSYGNVGLYDPVRQSDRLLLDGQTLTNLDVLVSSCSAFDSSKGTLFGLLDHCVTPFGRRLLRLWTCHPLIDIAAINARLDAVEYLLENSSVVSSLAGQLKGLPDLERMLARIHSGSVRVKDFLTVLDAFRKIVGLVVHLASSMNADEKATPINTILACFPDFEFVLESFEEAFDMEVARKEGTKRELYGLLLIHKGNIIPAPGVHEAFDESNEEMNSINTAFADYLKDQQKALDCRDLRYKDMGKELFQLEVPSHVKVPTNGYMLMSKTKAVNRYWTSTIKDLVKRFQEAEVRQNEALRSIFAEILSRFSQHSAMWRLIVDIVAQLDCLQSLAQCSSAMSEPKCRPQFIQSDEAVLIFEDLRHPCISKDREASFIPNDLTLGGGAASMLLLTGPNMGGKSTLLRQVCLSVIMAQIGCYVPAKSYQLTPVDRIFTRLGANDNILAGQSTFMVELTETAQILHNATSRSLVILDELGRGTSTFDGLAIAHAVLAYLTQHIGCRGLFATHYRQLAVDMESDRKTRCAFMACNADNALKKIMFLYKLQDGISPKSYGMNVAALAGVPKEIIDEADLIAEQFEQCLSISEQAHMQAPIRAADLFNLILASL